MRKLIVFNIISLDGYHTGPDNDPTVMFPMMGGVFDTYNAELLRRADVLLVGRVSFELFQSFWPKVAENPTSEEWTPEQRELSQACRRVPADCRPQTPTGKDILMTGSRTLWNDLLAHDLVDEIHLMIGNIILGTGIPVFEGKPDVSLRLIDIRRWEDSDNVLVRYEVRHKNV